MADVLVGMTGQPLSKQPREMNPLLLAYVGDAVYELFIRYHLVAKGGIRPKEVHREAVKYVSAVAQADVVRELESSLSEEERDILLRGRNAKSGSVPRNARVSDYRYSTGLEALVGYWYLSGQTERLQGMMVRILDQLENNGID